MDLFGRFRRSMSRRPAFAVSAALLAFCGQAAAQERFSFSQNAGVAWPRNGKLCLAIANRSLRAGTRIHLIQTVPPQTISEATLVKPDESCSKTSDTNLALYELRAAEPLSSPAIGVVAATASFRKSGNLIVADLDRDGNLEYFRSCASSEGLHFTIWSGQPLQGAPRWHQYHYLGYDIEPDCMPREMLQPK